MKSFKILDKESTDRCEISTINKETKSSALFNSAIHWSFRRRKVGGKGAEEIELTEAQQAAAGAIDLYSLYPCV